jgi:hypothetical protein
MLPGNYIGTEKGEFVVSDRFVHHPQIIYVSVRNKTKKLLVVNYGKMRYTEYLHPAQGPCTCVGSPQSRNYI